VVRPQPRLCLLSFNNNNTVIIILACLWLCCRCSVLLSSRSAGLYSSRPRYSTSWLRGFDVRSWRRSIVVCCLLSLSCCVAAVFGCRSKITLKFRIPTRNPPPAGFLKNQIENQRSFSIKREPSTLFACRLQYHPSIRHNTVTRNSNSNSNSNSSREPATTLKQKAKPSKY